MHRLMNTEEAAEYLGTNPWWIRENIGHLGIPAIKLGRQWRFNQKELDGWLALRHTSEIF